MTTVSFVSGNDSCGADVELCVIDRKQPYFVTCMHCGTAPASIVEVGCGHISLCTWCCEGSAYLHNRDEDLGVRSRCAVCKKESISRVDVSRFLNQETGDPSFCYMCRSRLAEVLVIPCGCLCHCAHCFKDTRGCLACGEEVTGQTLVLWPEAGLSEDASQLWPLRSGGSANRVNYSTPLAQNADDEQYRTPSEGSNR